MKVSVIGLGAWQAGFKSWGRNYTLEDIRGAVTRAIDNGVNFIDTAEIYGYGRSERVLGEILGGRDDIYIATKISGYNARPGKISKSIKGSLKRLGRKYIDLYQVHWPPSYYTNISKVIQELEKLVDQGYIRYIGVSNFSIDILEKTITSTRKYEIVSNQVQYSLLYRAAEKNLIPYMKENGIELIAWSPLAKGALAGKLKADAPAKVFDTAFKRAKHAQALFDTLAEISDKYNSTISQISLAWLVSKGAIPIPGAKNPAQAKQNAQAGDIILDHDDVSKLDNLSEDFIDGDIGSVMPRVIPNIIQQALIRLLGGV
jgi:aryl-alcohol dehydrogenase-like predicted oxidoreductase